jgi:type VI secretion system secreted protein VgrG
MKRGQFELQLHSRGFDTTELRIHRLRARERMGQLFELELEVVTLGADAPLLEHMVGASATVSVEHDGRTVRRFHGLLCRGVELSELGHERRAVRLTLVPRLWHATLVQTLDVDVDASLPEVIERKLGLLDLAVGSDYALHLVHAYPKRELVVQYQETDLAFLSRLCEHAGIFFFFAHGVDASTLVLGDHSGAYRRIEGDEDVHYRPRGEQQGVFELQEERLLVPGTYVCRDYNDQTPALELQLEHDLGQGFAGAVIEYGGNFCTPDEGKHLARVRAEEQLGRHQIFTGRSDDPRLAPGHTFKLADHPRHSGDLLLTSVEHEARQDVAGWGDGSEQHYENRFAAIPADVTYRLPRATPVPRVHGVVSGVIETWQGALERHAKIDQQGRYLVRFLFDTAAPGERKASCAVRMMQPSAGPGYGMHFPLKPGVEVLVSFVDGNPDRPVILGAVPNPITPTPVDAGVSTKSRIQTRAGIIIEFDDADRG